MSPLSPEDPLRTSAEGPIAGTEGLPRVDAAAVEIAQPRLLDAAVRGPVVLTRHGRDSFVLLPRDAFERLAREAGASAAARIAATKVIEG